MGIQTHFNKGDIAMSTKEKLESLAKNSIELKIDGKEQYKLGATRFGG